MSIFDTQLNKHENNFKSYLVVELSKLELREVTLLYI